MLYARRKRTSEAHHNANTQGQPELHYKPITVKREQEAEQSRSYLVQESGLLNCHVDPREVASPACGCATSSQPRPRVRSFSISDVVVI